MEVLDMFEAHYYFNDRTHNMDALLRNRCEAELLAIILEASSLLDIDINLLSEAAKEGGFKDRWKTLGKNATQITLILTIITTLLTVKTSFNSENDDLERRLNELKIEETKLNIEKLKKEIKNIESLNESTTKKVIKHLSKNLKIIKRKSNFYSLLSQYEKITKVGFGVFNENSPINNEKIVLRENFSDHILTSNKINTLEEEAEIELISPVLKEGNYKWKGVYEKKIINFEMSDPLFKDLILLQNIPFQHGTKIICILRIKRELDETGDVKVAGYLVTTVIEKIDNNSTLQTQQGKAYRQAKKLSDSQGKLFT